MPTDLDPLFQADSPPLPLSLSDQQHARDEIELVSLRATVVSLLEEIRLGAAAQTPGVVPQQSGANIPVPVHPAQAEFLSMLAHELRNPLQSMAMANQLLTGVRPLSQTVVNVHGVLERQIGHMSRLLDDLLDASRATTGKMALQMTPLFLRDVIDAAVETSYPEFHRRQQHLHVSLPEHDITVTGDLIRLTQAFSNLLANASQFSHIAGSVALVAVCKGASVEVTIADDGAGIAPELQPFVFDMFTQGQRTLERVQGGLGIGLSLVRTIVDLHGGNSAVASPGIGAGSVFTITLPLAFLPVALPPPSLAHGARAYKILVIEDNIDANEMMAMLLELEGHEATSSFDGADGLRLARDGRFDFVLCDLGLPKLTGFEVVAALKAARPQGGPFVIATTGYSDRAQRDLARAAGFDHYLVKPLDLTALFQVIAENGARP